MKNQNKSKNCALITGASDRIGRQMALFLAQKGYDVVIHYHHSKQKAADLANEIVNNFKVSAEIVCADFNADDSAAILSSFMKKNFPHWNMLLNNSSIFGPSKFIDDLDRELMPNLSIHLLTPLKLCNFFAKHIYDQEHLLKNDPHIINMIDKNIARFDTQNFYYLLTKKFLAEFTKMLALQLAPNIRVNGIAPGYILKDKFQNDDDVEDLRKKIPLKKIGNPLNITETLDFLIANNFIHGQILSIDGGASLNHAG